MKTTPAVSTQLGPIINFPVNGALPPLLEIFPSSYAWEMMLLHPPLSLPLEPLYHLAVIPASSFPQGPEGRKTPKFIRSTAKIKGLSPVRPEAMMCLCRNTSPDLLKKIGARAFIGMHEPIKDCSGDERLFVIRSRSEGGLMLSSIREFKDGAFSEEDAYVFEFPDFSRSSTY